MSVPTTNISFRAISNVFGGTDPISLSEYFANANPSYTSGVSGIPNIGSQISLSQFSGKSKPVVNVLVSGNKTANLDYAGYGSSMSYTDDSYLQIGMNFTFNFFGTDYGSNNNIFWNTNGAITFGSGSTTWTDWGTSHPIGFLLGQYDRYLNNIYLINTYTSGSYNVKRIVIDMRDYSSPYPDSDWEIRLIRGPDYQYIELSMNSTSYRGGYYWCGNYGGFFDVFGNGAAYGAGNPIGPGESFVLRSNLNGDTWTYFRNHRVNI